MLSKGLDFENVSLVGILNADMMLNFLILEHTSVLFN